MKPRIEWEVNPPAPLAEYAEVFFWTGAEILNAVKVMHSVGLIGCLDVNKPNLKLGDLFEVDE